MWYVIPTNLVCVLIFLALPSLLLPSILFNCCLYLFIIRYAGIIGMKWITQSYNSKGAQVGIEPPKLKLGAQYLNHSTMQLHTTHNTHMHAYAQTHTSAHTSSRVTVTHNAILYYINELMYPQNIVLAKYVRLYVCI